MHLKQYNAYEVRMVGYVFVVFNVLADIVHSVWYNREIAELTARNLNKWAKKF